MNTQHEHYDKERLNAISIAEVARRLGDHVRKVGVNHVTSCPWHDDEHPSLSLVEGKGKNYCHCFACDKGGDVISFTMQHEGWTFQEACQWLSQTFGISTLQHGDYVPRPKPRPVVKPIEPTYTYIPMEMVDELVSTENSLCQCLMHMFRSEAVEWVVEEYHIGCYSINGQDDYTVFPNIDRYGRVCNLKVQHYETDTASPRFGHSNACFWLGKMWTDGGKLPKGAVFKSTCLFGEHLIGRYPDSVVALVESPKNALFGALAFPQLTWVATGNKSMLRHSVLTPLQGRDVVVIPDCDAVDEWTQALKGMSDLANFTVSDFCQRNAPEGQPKFDIADYIAQKHAPIF